MKWKLVVLFLFLFGGSALGQFRQIAGVVLDGSDISLLKGVQVSCAAEADSVLTDAGGHFLLRVPAAAASLVFRIPGYGTIEKTLSPRQGFETVFLFPAAPRLKKDNAPKGPPVAGLSPSSRYDMPVSIKAHQDETYEQVLENRFEHAARFPYSAFMLNSDDASYCNVRRFLMSKQLPPKEAVRIEEMVNHLPFSYQVDSTDLRPLVLQEALTTCPWHPGHWLLRLAVQARNIPPDTVVPNNLVLLVDVSGSMEASNKLPLLKKAFRVLVNQMDSLDTMSVVVYAGSVSVALPPTSGARKSKILDVINNLSAGGSTAGQAGIELAFKLARDHFIEDGNNRVIIATDGDFNVGHSSDEDMRELITKYHDWGIFLTCIGVGMGNYKDSKLETLAQWGQGNFVYIDNDQEAQRVFSAAEYRKILLTFVRNACVKAIFNPGVVRSYRLIGYESRLSGKKDSLSSRLPGGEIGYGQRITAFYEIEPVDTTGRPLKGQSYLATGPEPEGGLALVALQYQTISDGLSHQTLTKVPVKVLDFSRADQTLRYEGAVTLFGMLLQHSEYLGGGSFALVNEMMRRLKGKWEKDDRKAFLKLVQKAAALETAGAHR